MSLIVKDNVRSIDADERREAWKVEFEGIESNNVKTAFDVTSRQIP